MAQSQSRLIRAEKVTVSRQGRVVLDNVSLEIAEHDFTTLVGPNGAGKTVLLRQLLQLEKPDHGTVQHAAGLRIGYVPEKISIDASLPLQVKRFVTLNNRVSAAALDTLADETGMTDLLDRPLAALSGGELQRVLLARALVRNPNLLVLDEPAQNLDVNGQLQFYQLIEKIYETRKLAILMVSHDLHLVMSSTRKVVCLYHHICCSGAPDSVARDPEFISIFGTDMAQLMAVYPHKHTHDHTHNPEHNLELTQAITQQKDVQ